MLTLAYLVTHATNTSKNDFIQRALKTKWVPLPTHICMHLHTHSKASEWSFMLRKLNWTTQQTTTIAFDTRLFYRVFIANQLLLCIYSLFFTPLSCSSLFSFVCAFFRAGFNFIRLFNSHICLSWFDCISSSVRKCCHCGRCSAAIKPLTWEWECVCVCVSLSIVLHSLIRVHMCMCMYVA